MSTISPQDEMSVYDVAALTLGELANLIKDIRVEFEQVQAAAAEAEARLASQQVELTDWILVADGVKHDWRCGHGELGTDLCLRCQLEAATARVASHGEQIAKLTKAITQWEGRVEMLRQKVDDYQWDIGQLERQSTVLRQRTTELEADLAAALTARDEAERRILREVAKLPSPWGQHVDEPDGCESLPPEWTCLWCPAEILQEEDGPEPSHPDNGCLWPRAQAALLQPADPSADPPKEQT